MTLREEQRDLIQANIARDRAEQILAELKRVAAEAEKNENPELTDEQRTVGKDALEKAIESAQRMVDSLNAAMKLAQDATNAGGWQKLDEKRDAEELDAGGEDDGDDATS